MTAGLLAAQPGGWTGAPSGDGGAAVPDAWLLLSDAAFAGLLPGYAFAQSVTQTLSLTAADNIGDGGTLELDGPRGIAVFESDGSTYAAVTVHDDNRVQILNVTDPSATSPPRAASPMAVPSIWTSRMASPRSHQAAAPTRQSPHPRATASRYLT